MKAYLAMPTGEPKAGIVVVQEIMGVNKDIRAMTDTWAAKGYAAIAPDLRIVWRESCAHIRARLEPMSAA